MKTLTEAIAQTVKDAYDVDLKPELTRPEEQFGDYATNIALQLAGRLGRRPREIAEELAPQLHQACAELVAQVTVAGPGFINITLSDAALVRAASEAKNERPTTFRGQTVVMEYSDPNPFKVLHAGHLYTTLVGDSLSRLVETTGATVHRVNFGGDVGMHVAKTMWGIIAHNDMDEAKALSFLEDMAARQPDAATRMAELATRYVEANTAYETSEQAKQEITEINTRVYGLFDDVHASQRSSDPFARLYWLGRAWSYEYFDAFYADLAVKPFEKYYPESVTAPEGIRTVKEQQARGVYEESDGAVVFNGEKYGLHTRVFINSRGLPTYEAKDVGLSIQKWDDYHFDASIIITGNDIVEYMKVVLKSIEQFNPNLAERTRHITHGQVKLEGGVKMSSRKGNGLLATDILAAATEATEAARGKPDKQSAYAAVKYSFLRQRIGGDIIYLPKESVSLEGNSGPYLQYAHVRARSILAKAGSTKPAELTSFVGSERSLARKLSEYPEVLEKAVAEFIPHHICTYLYELAQVFNRFYEQNRVIGDAREGQRLTLVSYYADVLQDGLQLLGIAAPERM